MDCKFTIPKRNEWILSAAIHYRDGKIYKEQPKEIKSGIVLCGRRHNNCILNLEALFGDKYDEKLITPDTLGFITSKNRFVSRAEGYKIAVAAGQMEERKEKEPFNPALNAPLQDLQILTSEDLYYDDFDEEEI